MLPFFFYSYVYILLLKCKKLKKIKRFFSECFYLNVLAIVHSFEWITKFHRCSTGHSRMSPLSLYRRWRFIAKANESAFRWGSGNCAS